MKSIFYPASSPCRVAQRVAFAGSLSFALFSASVGAAETNFVGFTDGCFATSLCAPPTTPASPSQSISFQGLTYNNSTFDVTTAGGFVSIGNMPGVPNVNNLGSFTLTGAPGVYNGEHLDLRVTFTLPLSTTPGTVVFSDIVMGTVNSVDNGGVFVDVDNSVHHLVVGSGSTTGLFDFFVNDVSLTPGYSVALTGTIIATPVPEAEGFALMLAGLGLLGLVTRRRGNP